MIRVKRVHDPYESDDVSRFLVDRLWPRGMKKENLQMDGWLKDVAPVMHYDAGSGMIRPNGRSFVVDTMLNLMQTAKLGALFWIWPGSRTSPCSSVRMTRSTTMPWHYSRFWKHNSTMVNDC